MAEEQWTEVDQYFSERLLPRDPSLESALETSASAGLPAISVSPNQGKFLQILAQLVEARSILEIGTLGGYSTIWLARGLRPGGRLITLEVGTLILVDNVVRSGDKYRLLSAPRC